MHKEYKIRLLPLWLIGLLLGAVIFARSTVSFGTYRSDNVVFELQKSLREHRYKILRALPKLKTTAKSVQTTAEV